MNHSVRGFSLLELVMVMAVLAVAALVLLPRWQNRQNRGLTTQVESIHRALQEAKLQAMVSGKPQFFIWNPDTREWAVGSTSGRVDSNVQVVMIYGQTGNTLATPARIGFYPEGVSTGGRLRFTTQTHTTQLEVDWLTGQTRSVELKP